MTEIKTKISKLIDSDNVVLFMKGNSRLSSMWFFGSSC